MILYCRIWVGIVLEKVRLGWGGHKPKETLFAFQMPRLSRLVAQQLQEAHYLPPFSRKIPKGKGLNAGGLPLCFGHLCNQEYPTLVFKVDLVTMSET